MTTSTVRDILAVSMAAESTDQFGIRNAEFGIAHKASVNGEDNPQTHLKHTKHKVTSFRSDLYIIL